MVGKDLGYAMWERIDGENYSGLLGEWKETGPGHFREVDVFKNQWLDDFSVRF